MAKTIRIIDIGTWINLSATFVRENLSQKIREEIFDYDNYTCQYCGTKEPPFEVDHVDPISKGGSNEIYNLICSCSKCNREKRNRTPEEWLQDLIGSQ